MKVTVRQTSREFINVRQDKETARLTIRDLQPSFLQSNLEGEKSKVIVSKPGTKGSDGSKIYSAAGFPDNNVGVPGDYSIDTISARLYGPKTMANIWDGIYISLTTPGTGGGTALITEEFTVNSTIQNDKYVMLSLQPTSVEDIEFSVFGGVEQRPNVDFYLVGNKIAWDGLALEYLLDIGTTFAVRYTI